MKKSIIALSVIVLSGVASAQRTLIYSTPPTQARSSINTTWYQPYFNEDGGATYSWIGKGADLWLRDQSHITNRFVRGGDSVFMRGGVEPNLVVFIEANMRGRIMSVGSGGDGWYGNAFNFANNNTRIVGLDDPALSSVTGYSGDRSNRNQKQPDNAVTILVRQNTGDTSPEKNMGSYTFVEGNYFGGKGRTGGVIDFGNNIRIEGASFIGADFDSSATDDEGIVSGGARPGLWVGHLKGLLTISNKTGKATDRFEAGSFNSGGVATGGSTYDRTASQNGGSGLYVNIAAGGTTIHGGTFIGSHEISGNLRTLEYTDFDTISGYLSTYGGPGATLRSAGAINIYDGLFLGGDAGNVTVGGPDGTAVSVGGAGLYVQGGGVTKILGGRYEAGVSGTARIVPGGYYIIGPDGKTTVAPPTDVNGSAVAYGASGIFFNGSGVTTISNVTAIGSRGTSANASEGDAMAYGGSGITAINTALTIQSGTFTGANGGSANSKGNAIAIGGSGVLSSGGDLTITGGEFRGGKGGIYNGTSDDGNFGLTVLNAALTVSKSSGNTLIDGDIYFNNSAAKNLGITGGTITGDIYKYGIGTTTMTVSTNASYAGSFVQNAGIVNVNLGNSSQSKFFSDVQIESGTMNLNGTKVITAENSSFSLGSQNSVLNFAAGLDLSKGSSIDAGYGTVKVTANNLVMGDNSKIAFSFDSLSGVGGSVTIGGNLVASNSNNKIIASGVSATPTGTKKIVTSTRVILGGNKLEDVVDVDFGWLTRLGNINTNGGITVAYEYNSLTNGSLSDLDPVLLTNVDAIVRGSNSNDFYKLNSGGEANGTQMFRYSLSQLPDVADSAFQTQQQVAQQIAARGTEFRSMNGYASTKPRFGKPTGAAGPKVVPEEQTMQGWIRAYGAFANQGKEGNFASYDSGTWGTVVGVDKCFGNLLVGLAGGYARTDLDAGTAYSADVDTYHGTVYSTIGGEDTFVDLALTYGLSTTEELNGTSKSEFDSDIFSGYIGGGKTFEAKGKVNITPEASMLVSYYNQEAFNRAGDLVPGGMNVADYDAWSTLGALGVNLATVHQIDWMNRGLAFIPEIRAHWLHEFNPDLDNGNFTYDGGSGLLYVRPRDENMFRFGAGFDIWSWKFQSTKFEFDYDGLYASGFSQHIFSGKITVSF